MQIFGEQVREDLSRNFTMLKPRIANRRQQGRKQEIRVCLRSSVLLCSGTSFGAKRHEQDSSIRVNRRDQPTNDGATILNLAIQLDNAAAKILVNISKVRDDEVGDGTTSKTVPAVELLREAEKLTAKKVQRQTIVEGYRIASLAALKALEKAEVTNL